MARKDDYPQTPRKPTEVLHFFLASQGKNTSSGSEEKERNDQKAENEQELLIRVGKGIAHPQSLVNHQFKTTNSTEIVEPIEFTLGDQAPLYPPGYEPTSKTKLK